MVEVASATDADINKFFLFHFICIKIDFHKTQYLDIYYHNFQQMIGFGGSQSGNMFLEKTGTE